MWAQKQKKKEKNSLLIFNCAHYHERTRIIYTEHALFNLCMSVFIFVCDAGETGRRDGDAVCEKGDGEMDSATVIIIVIAINIICELNLNL